MLTKYNEWINDKELNAELGGFNMDTPADLGILANQLEQLVTRLEGLLHGVSEAKKSVLVDRFMRKIEERILGL